MNKTTDSIEVSKTTLIDCKKAFIFVVSISGFASVLFAIMTHLYVCGFLIFILFGVLDPRIYILLRTPFRFDFKEGQVFIYYHFYGKTKIKKVPCERFVIIKEYWHKKPNNEYTVSYSDKKHPSFYSFRMPGLSSTAHWDQEALDYLLYLAEKNGVTIKTWDYPIRWGK